MNAPEEIFDMDILSMLNAILGTHEISVKPDLEKKSKHQKEVGIIHSRTTRRLVTAKKLITDHADILEQKFLYYKVILHELFWLSISEEFPDVILNDHASIGEVWVLIGEKDWCSSDPKDPPLKIPQNLMREIGKIVSGQNLKKERVKFAPLIKNDKVICQIKDERIKALWSLIVQLEIKRAEIGLLYFAVDKKERKKQEKVNCHYFSLVRLLYSLFWCAIRDSLPSSIDWFDDRICLKDDWKIVKSFDQKEEFLEEIFILDEILTKKFDPGLN